MVAKLAKMTVLIEPLDGSPTTRVTIPIGKDLAMDQVMEDYDEGLAYDDRPARGPEVAALVFSVKPLRGADGYLYQIEEKV